MATESRKADEDEHPDGGTGGMAPVHDLLKQETSSWPQAWREPIRKFRDGDTPRDRNSFEVWLASS